MQAKLVLLTSTKHARCPTLMLNCPVALLFVVSVMYCVTCVSDPWSSHILHYYGFLLHIIEHCLLSVHYLSLSTRSSRVMGVALSLSSGQPFAGKVVDFWEESLHRRPCVLSVCPLFFYRSALHQLMTRIDTMREEKRCD